VATSKLGEKPNDLPYLGLEHIESKTGRLLLETPVEQVESTVNIFESGDVLFGKLRPYLAKAALVDFAGTCTTELLALRPDLDTEGKHLFYFILSDGFIKLVSSMTYGAKMPRVSSEQIGNIAVPFPPLPEQRAIATFLDRETSTLDTLIAKKARLIELLREKRTALISHAVTRGLDPAAPRKDSGVPWPGEIPTGWEVVKIKHLCQIKRGASPRPIDDPVYFDNDGEYAWVRIADVTASERYLVTTTQRLSELGRSKSVSIEPGELFLSIAATVGKPIITKIKCCIHDGFVYFVGLRQDREYLYYLFSGGEIYQGIGKIGTQLNLNTDTIGDIYIPVPPLPEQRAIAAYLDQETARLDTLIAKVQQGIALLREYRTALISAAVTGTIDVREHL
jgi:type I restriction enzyme S subunit